MGMGKEGGAAQVDSARNQSGSLNTSNRRLQNVPLSCAWAVGKHTGCVRTSLREGPGFGLCGYVRYTDFGKDLGFPRKA